MFISTLLSRIVILTAGTLYPVYRSYKAVRNKDVKEYVKWMMYWIVFGIFCAGEAVADIFLAFWFPFYYELKIIFVFWLLSPWTRGASILYRNWVHPMFMKHEEEIDNFLEQAKNESYRQVVSLGSRGLSCARDIVATAALRGAAFSHVQLTDLQRSYSTGDINNAGKGGGGERKRTTTTTTVVYQKQAATTSIEEEHLGDNDDEAQVRTWTGSYDEHGNIVENAMAESNEAMVKKVNDEELVVIEDPISSKPRRSDSVSRRSRSRSRKNDEINARDRRHVRVATIDLLSKWKKTRRREVVI
ncbi:hypothetical protein niasHS_014658 [Heterodera schachtii]|uniref:Receptor expression-enhancing protein n=1 Tax=Heterodera schachtii TaxID=97005 RepID=A0ABD2IHY2_HETSC